MSSSDFSAPDYSSSASDYMVRWPRNSSYSSISEGEIASLPSESTATSEMGDDLSLSDDDYSDAEEQWRESIQQLELLLTMVIIPFVGKYFGRKCAYWGWTRFMEWKYPLEVVMTNQVEFRIAGVLGAAASL